MTEGNFVVGIHRLDIFPHENADALEIAVVGGVVSECMNASCVAQGEHNHEMIIGGFRAIVPKGQYKTGDYALYIPEAALVPDDLLEEIGLTGRLSGSGKNRVKAIRLRGVVSQGIVCRPEIMKLIWQNIGTPQTPIPDDLEPWDVDWYTREVLTEDFAALLGIVKWQPKVPGQMRGKIRERGDSRILPWIEITNIKKEMREWRDGEPVVATEKIHGTHCMVTLAKVYAQPVADQDGPSLATVGEWTGEWEFLVSSKGMGKQGWDLVEEDGNVYWRAARQYRLEEWLRAFVAASNWEGGEPDRIGLYGEVFGESVQDLNYGFMGSDLGYRAFDMKIDHDWVNAEIFEMFVAGVGAYHGERLPLVPVLYRGPYDYGTLVLMASGLSLVGGLHMREGLVIRPTVEERDGSGARKIAKFISDAYLLRDKGTEFE